MSDIGIRFDGIILLAALLFLGFWPKSVSTSLNAALAETNHPAQQTAAK